ncbi:migration and invasion-inhibitory protein isoform X1 [Ursus americanus]|uniref:migration and invasion-inhibitory protein isoform X1 n=1 Tax=Ursus americanus TaxID=9643 RepID=UPI001E67D503|nr:migration and invasion-inhibitory protein isoform X1 [Ursus americanus]XP_045633907.1 migration and invasion-inhibitory protein isoform X1 [Ursus americanus]
MPGMVETKDLVQLRQLNLVLLRQLWVGQDAMRRSVAKAASKSARDSSSSYDSQTSSSQETSLMALRASSLQDAHQADPCDMSWPGGTSSEVVSFPSAKYRHQASLGSLRPCLAPLLAISDSNDPEPSAELDSPGPQEAQAQSSTRDQQSRLSKSRVTLSEESALPDTSWRLRPYLGYDWIAGSLDNSSPVTSKPEAFFSKLQDFREANKEECIHSDPEPRFLGPRESSGGEEDHECVYCYRVSRRLFLVPSDPGAPCRLCRTPRDQRRPETLVEPAQVRVSIPLSVLDPPHCYHIHRRKSFDASNTLALPRHCLLGWDILPPKSEKSSAPKSLDLWSCVSSEAQHRKLSAANPSHLVWSRVPQEGQMPWSRPGGADRSREYRAQKHLLAGPQPPGPRHPPRLFRSLPAPPPHPGR